MSALLAALGTIAAAALIAAPGCGDDGPTVPQDSDGPLVAYERGGGIAGVAERLVVRGDGTATLTVGVVDERQEELELADAELDRLTADLEAADFAAVEPAAPGACADCFIEAVTYDGRTTTVVAEIVEPPESVSAVLAQLRATVASG